MEKITKIINESLPEGIRLIGRPRARLTDQVYAHMDPYGTNGTGI